MSVIQELSLARRLEDVMAIVRHAARDLTGADGATFVLRDAGQCYYADEDAIAPLWKGRRFPLESCISGWAMLHREPAVIEDIYADPRIPADAYRATFVKSLAMVPIRTAAPIGAIGNYWATPHRATDEEVRVLQALADSTSVAMENVQLYADLERRVQERTRLLEEANRELEAFSYSVSHDLRAPLRAIDGFSRALLEDHAAALDEKGQDHLRRLTGAAKRMSSLIDDLLALSQVGRTRLERERVDVTAMARSAAKELDRAAPDRKVDWAVEEGLVADADAGLLRIALENLLGNAWKYTRGVSGARVELRSGGEPNAFLVRDNGAGFDPAHADKLFTPFGRLHSAREFPGSGIGLATVARIIHRHGGQVSAEGSPGAGATFFWSLPPSP